MAMERSRRPRQHHCRRLSGTDVTQTNLDLASALGGSAADAAVDTVTVSGTDGDDNIAVNGNGSGATVSGLPGAVSVTHADPTDVLAVSTLAGNDHVAGVLFVGRNGAPAGS